MTDLKMTFVEHLDELRTRSIACIMSVVIGMFIAFYFYEPWILNVLKGPLDSLSGRHDNPFAFDNILMRFLRKSSDPTVKLALDLHFIGPLEVIMVKIKASFFAGLMLVSPFVLYQFWAFVAAGLTDIEKKAVRLFFPISLGLFVFGVVLAYVVMLPVFLYFLVCVTGSGLIPMLILTKYVTLVVWCCLMFGLVFETPMVILLLSWLGVVTPDTLASKRRYAILIIFIVAAILTPPDAVSQIIVAVPMCLLYEAGIWFARIPWLRREKDQSLPTASAT